RPAQRRGWLCAPARRASTSLRRGRRAPNLPLPPTSPVRGFWTRWWMLSKRFLGQAAHWDELENSQADTRRRSRLPANLGTARPENAAGVSSARAPLGSVRFVVPSVI